MNPVAVIQKIGDVVKRKPCAVLVGKWNTKNNKREVNNGKFRYCKEVQSLTV